jgi:hypothetical protein
MCVIFTINYFLVGGDVSVNSEVFLVTGFINLNIKSIQSFRDAHKNMMHMCIFIRVSDI